MSVRIFTSKARVNENERECEEIQSLFRRNGARVAYPEVMLDYEHSLVNKWSRGSLSCWKQSSGQGRSRTWRFRLFMKTVTERHKARTRTKRQVSEYSWGPSSKLPISIESQLGRPTKRRKPKFSRSQLGRDAAKPSTFGDDAFPDHLFLGVEVDASVRDVLQAPTQRSRRDCSSLPVAATTIALRPYENFVGAFLTPYHRVGRLIKSGDHGDIYAAEHLERPQDTIHVKVCSMVGLSKKVQKYRMSNLKKLEKGGGHVETIHQQGRKLVIYRPNERLSAVRVRTQGSAETVSHGYQLLSVYLRARATVSNSEKPVKIPFSKIHLQQAG